ncbi:MAG: cell division protein FtsZ [Candidatus Firestonebacteria bacterium]|nr:cell division protein FtsZ [Candidatus Firestonebacteria bacterium]
MLDLKFENEFEHNANIKVIGIGGGGCNAVNRMVIAKVKGVEFITANTDAQALGGSLAPIRLQIGAKLTKGLGSGSNPDIGEKAANEDQDKLKEVLKGADMVFITAGMGGGTGTGAAPIIASIARDLGALTIAVVTKPFMFEGKKRAKQAEDGINKLKESVDTLITIPNQRLLSVANKRTPILESFNVADDILKNAVQGISDLITIPGLINLDFADVRTIMSGMGSALMGMGFASGDDRAIEAAQQAISSPLLEDISINGARGVLINITGGPDLGIMEVNEASSLIYENADENAHIILGAVIDEKMKDSIKITVIATGFEIMESAKKVETIEKEVIQNKLTQQDKLFSIKPNISPKELEKPAFIRKAVAQVACGGGADIQIIQEDESMSGLMSKDERDMLDDRIRSLGNTHLDIPTFLRNKID